MLWNVVKSLYNHYGIDPSTHTVEGDNSSKVEADVNTETPCTGR